MRKRGQAAMEFLFSYGSMILVIVIAGAAMHSFGLFNEGSYTKGTCVGSDRLHYRDHIFGDTGVFQLHILNGAGKHINVTGIDVSYPEQDEYRLGSYYLQLNENDQGIIIMQGSFGQLDIDRKYSAKVRINYDDLHGLDDQTEILVCTGRIIDLDALPIADAGPNLYVQRYEEVQFDGTDSYDPEGGELTYSWTFGGGATGSGSNPTHIYTTQGLKPVTLTVCDPLGGCSQDSITVGVDVGAYTIHLQDVNGDPVNTIMWAYKMGSYISLGQSGWTGSDGDVTFFASVGDTALGRWRYMGVYNYTDTVVVTRDPTQNRITAVIPEFQETTFSVVVRDTAGNPMHVPTWAYHVDGSSNVYLDQSGWTGSDGNKTFNALVGQTVKVRLRWLGEYAWTGEITVVADPQQNVITHTLTNHTVTDWSLSVSDVGDQPVDARVWAYSLNAQGNPVYMDQSGNTGSNGNITFYGGIGQEVKVRLLMFGVYYWTTSINLTANPAQNMITYQFPNVTSASISIFDQSGEPANVRVWMYSGTGQYLGQSGWTGSDGQFDFVGTVGDDVKGRVRVSGQNYWTDTILLSADPSANQLNYTLPNVTSYPFTVLVKDADGDPLNLPVWAYTEDNSYLDLSGWTGDDGNITFSTWLDLRVRAKTRRLGVNYWSDWITIQSVYDLNVITITLPATNETQWTVSVLGSDGSPVNDRVWAYTEDNRYMDQTGWAGSDGNITFIGAVDQVVKAKVRHQGQDLWTEFITLQADETANHLQITTPNATESSWTVSVTDAAGDPADIRAWAYTEAGRYMDQSGRTGTDGNRTFTAPVGSEVKARLRLDGEYYWTDYITVGTNPANNLITYQLPNVTNVLFTVTIYDAEASPLNVPVWAYTEAGSYLDQSGWTGSDGTITFQAAVGTGVKARTRISGEYHWTDYIELGTDPQQNTITFYAPAVTDTQYTVSLTDEGGDPLNLRVWAYNENGVYMDQWAWAGADGNVTFNGEVGDRVKARTQSYGIYYWTGIITLSSNPLNNIIAYTVPSITEADVTVSLVDSGGSPQNLPVWLYTESGAYLGQSGSTGADGNITFTAEVGTLLKARTRVDGVYQWTDYINVTTTAADNIITYTVPTVTTTTLTAVFYEADSSFANVPVWLYLEDNSYLGYGGWTGADGNVTYEAGVGKGVKARTRYYGVYYYSDTITLTSDPAQNVITYTLPNLPEVGWNVTLADTNGTLINARVWAYTESGGYMDPSGWTQADGMITFIGTISEGVKARTRYYGTYYWSDYITLSSDPTQNAVSIELPMVTPVDVNVTVLDAVGDPMNVRVQLYTEAQGYMDQSAWTGTDGNVTFSAGVGMSVMARVRVNSVYYWSDFLTVSADEGTNIIVYQHSS